MKLENNKELKVGDPVRYQPKHYGNDKWENGIVKEIPTHTTEAVRVVYNCGNDWGNYKKYTSALTNLRDLKRNWKVVEVVKQKSNQL